MLQDKNDKKPDRDYWDKPTWRERDDKNKQSPHGIKDTKPIKASSLDKRKETLAKKDLEDLFKPKTSPEETKAWAAVAKTSGPGFSKAASSYLDKFGYPKEWGDLILLLDHQDPIFITELLNHMKELLPHQTDTKKELFRGKLRVLLASCDDYSLSKNLEALLN